MSFVVLDYAALCLRGAFFFFGFSDSADGYRDVGVGMRVLLNEKVEDKLSR